MRTSTIDERFSDLMGDPSTERFFAVRELILERSDFAPYSSEWHRVGELYEAREFSRVLGAWERLQLVGVLSPRLHFWAGTSALELGDEATAAWERSCMQTCLQELLNTGDGEEDAPFVVTYRWDAYDLMRALGVQPCQQMLVETACGMCDRIRCDDGSEFWFDVQQLVDSANGVSSLALRRYLHPAMVRNS